MSTCTVAVCRAVIQEEKEAEKLMAGTGLKVAHVAVAAAVAHKAGRKQVTIGHTVFDLRTGGMCERFVRQCYEAAMQTGDHSWEYARDTARNTEEALREAGFETDSPQRGDIVCMNGTSGSAGHIGILLGDGTVAHNTSSHKWNEDWSGRDEAGTCITSVGVVAHLISGYYHVLPTLVVQFGNRVFDCKPEFDGLHVRVNTRKFMELVGMGGPDVETFIDVNETGLIREVASYCGFTVDATHLMDEGVVELSRKKGN